MLRLVNRSRPHVVLLIASLFLSVGCSSTAPTSSVSSRVSPSPSGSRSLALEHPPLGVIALDLPDVWNRASFTFSPPGGPTIDGIVATPDLEGWRQTYGVPGIFLGASEELAAQLHLDGDPFGDPSKITDWMVPIFDKVLATCSDNIGTDIFDAQGVYGYTDIYSNCDGASSVLVTVAASSDAETILLIEQVAPTDADLTAAQDTLASFKITESQS